MLLEDNDCKSQPLQSVPKTNLINILDSLSGYESKFEDKHWLIEHVVRCIELLERLQYVCRRFDIVGHQWSRVRNVDSFEWFSAPAQTMTSQLDAFYDVLGALDKQRPAFEKVQKLALDTSQTARRISETVAKAGNELSRFGKNHRPKH